MSQQNQANQDSTLIHILVAVGLLLLAATMPVDAGEGHWSVTLQPLYVDVSGHDPHVLTIHQIQFDSERQLTQRDAISLETENGPGYRGEFRYNRGPWSWGFDFFWYVNSQVTAPQSSAAGGSFERIDYQIADRIYSSNGAQQVLYYQTLEDNELQAWTADIYAMRTLMDSGNGRLRLQIGIRSADFDNDYRAVVGLEGVGGTRQDASSNYPRMSGPMVGFEGEFNWGKNQVTGSFSQSATFGTNELSSQMRDFDGDFSEEPDFTSDSVFHLEQDAVIPISEFRIQWRYQWNDHLGIGGGIHTSAWWDVPIPPGADPVVGGSDALRETSVIFTGLFLSGTISF